MRQHDANIRARFGFLLPTFQDRAQTAQADYDVFGFAHSISSARFAREVFGLRQLDKAESSRPTSDLVPNDDRRGHLKAGLRNEFVEGSVRRAVGKITYEQFSQLILQLRAALREGPPD